MKETTIKIDKNVPMPVGGGRKTSGLMFTIKSMKVGDSFLHPIKTRTGLSGLAMRCQISITTRTVDKDNVRVWRIK